MKPQDFLSKKEAAPVPRGGERRYLPLLTLSFLLITAIGAVLQLLFPEVFLALRRDPAALEAGEGWRILSPLLVLDGEVFWHFVYDALGLFLVGALVERLLGRGRWLILFFAAALAGNIAGYAWNPYGAGASTALCGLIGGLVIWQIKRSDFYLLASLYALGLASVLALEAIIAVFIANALFGIVVAALACGLLINLLLRLLRRKPDTSASAYFVFAVVLLSALALVVLRDLHGVALLTGLGVAALLRWRKPIFRRLPFAR
ncbi:MAG TPA: rhomboid family intramembrane serine protease [Ktedonobacterales bacterium]|jgi:membrane associated rhomboid family serine protease